MIMDFSTGWAMDAHNTNPDIYHQLETNHKGVTIMFWMWFTT